MNYFSGSQQEFFWSYGRQPHLTLLLFRGRYSVIMSQRKDASPQGGIGLCADCRFMRLIESDRASKFYLCERSTTDARFPKYPRLPVLQCTGYERVSADPEQEA